MHLMSTESLAPLPALADVDAQVSAMYNEYACAAVISIHTSEAPLTILGLHEKITAARRDIPSESVVTYNTTSRLLRQTLWPLKIADHHLDRTSTLTPYGEACAALGGHLQNLGIKHEVALHELFGQPQRIQPDTSNRLRFSSPMLRFLLLARATRLAADSPEKSVGSDVFLAHDPDMKDIVISPVRLREHLDTLASIGLLAIQVERRTNKHLYALAPKGLAVYGDLHDIFSSAIKPGTDEWMNYMTEGWKKGSKIMNCPQDVDTLLNRYEEHSRASWRTNLPELLKQLRGLSTTFTARMVRESLGGRHEKASISHLLSALTEAGVLVRQGDSEHVYAYRLAASE